VAFLAAASATTRAPEARYRLTEPIREFAEAELAAYKNYHPRG